MSNSMMDMLSPEEYAKMMEEDEARVQEHPCCLNCKHCISEYGQDFCYYEGSEDAGVGMQEEYELWEQFCKMWRSCVTGAEWKGEQ